MPRPQKTRYVSSYPEMVAFGPCGSTHKGVITITVEEFEAIRLSDYECMDQGSAAEMMEISRHTYGRLLGNARKIIAKALVIGMELRIEGGNFEFRGIGQQRRRGKGCNRGGGKGNGRG